MARRPCSNRLICRMQALGAVPAMFTSYARCNTDKFPFLGRFHDIVHTVAGGGATYEARELPEA